MENMSILQINLIAITQKKIKTLRNALTVGRHSVTL